MDPPRVDVSKTQVTSSPSPQRSVVEVPAAADVAPAPGGSGPATRAPATQSSPEAWSPNEPPSQCAPPRQG